MVEVRFHPEARDDYTSALAWYMARSPRAADRFESEISRVIERIATAPSMFAKYDDHHQFVILHKFPYSIVYQNHNDFVEVVAVAHSHRSSDYWRGRA